MDQQLLELIGPSGTDADAAHESTRAQVKFLDERAGEVEVKTPEGTESYRLKPLAELYGNGVGAATVDPIKEEYTPLFLSIEEGIVGYDQSDPRLTDAKVLLTLERLGMSPEAEAGDDALARHLQLDLRLLLSLNDYSRQDVRGALRKIAKSVARHTRLAGPRGYLTFIRGQLSR